MDTIIVMMFLLGISKRKIKKIIKLLCGIEVFASTFSNISKEMNGYIKELNKSWRKSLRVMS